MKAALPQSESSAVPRWLPVRSDVIGRGASSSKPKLPPSFYFCGPAVHSIDQARVIRLGDPNENTYHERYSDPDERFDHSISRMFYAGRVGSMKPGAA